MSRLPAYSFMMLRRSVVLLSVVVGGACSAPPAAAPAPGPSATVDSTPVFVPLPDARTLAIVRMANNVELAYARIAARRASSRDVKALVRREQASHTQLNTSLDRLAARTDITPHEDEVSLLLRDQSMPRRDTLRALSGRHFDSAYVALEVQSHRELLVAIDSAFVRSVGNVRLAAWLADSLRPAVNAHLLQAERLQPTLVPRP
jgi:putative membrane protein